MNKSLIGGCGIFCGACDHYLSHHPAGEHLLLEEGAIKQRLLAHPCEGCKSTTLEKICIYCRNCAIRLCTIERDIITCAECEQFPCIKVNEFHSSNLLHKREAYKELATAPLSSVVEWVNHFGTRWSCKECGKPHTYYEKTCFSCGSDLDTLYPDNRT